MRLLALLTALTLTAFAATSGTVAAQEQKPDTLWQTQCFGPSKDPASLTCEASQSLRVKESGKLLFKVDVISPAGAPVKIMSIQAPLGFYLPGKLNLTVDDAPLADLDIASCDGRGCFLNTQLAPEMVTALKAGNSLKISFAPTADKRQAVEIPLTGFTRAMEAIQ